MYTTEEKLFYAFTTLVYCTVPACKSYGDEAGNDGTAAWSDPLFVAEFTLTEF